MMRLAEDWQNLLGKEMQKDYYKKLISFVEDQYSKEICYPPPPEIFAAFNFCNIENLKVVIIGQDPYHGSGQANGLCFSVKENVVHPPSLKNIFKEIANDLDVLECRVSGNLEDWAKQGVLLLNATLTVRSHQAGSHQKQGWEMFTDAVIKLISKNTKNTVFLLWGGFAKKKSKLIDTKKHHILTSGHPSPLSANRGYWFNNKHFSKTNQYLIEVGRNEIVWS